MNEREKRLLFHSLWIIIRLMVTMKHTGPVSIQELENVSRDLRAASEGM